MDDMARVTVTLKRPANGATSWSSRKLKRPSLEGFCSDSDIDDGDDTTATTAAAAAVDSDKDNRISADLLVEGELIALEAAKCTKVRKKNELFGRALVLFDRGLIDSTEDEKLTMKLHELRANIHLTIGSDFEAIKASERALEILGNMTDSKRTIAGSLYKTLGRAQMNIGEPRMGIETLRKAMLLLPDDKELLEEDLPWAEGVLTRLQASMSDTASEVGRVHTIEKQD